MAKSLGRSASVAARTLYAILNEIKNKGGSMSAKEIWLFAANNVSFSEWEAARAGKMQWERWRSATQFYSINYNKAGFIVKKGGVWYLTPEGEEALKLGEEQIMRAANVAYDKWKAESGKKETEPNEDEIDAEVSKDIAVNIEELEGRALDDILQYIRNKGPYDFQDMVAALLRAMGYYTPFIAPKGKDGGVDIIAYLDPLGAKEPRIKVQVKHMPDIAISSKDIQALVGVLKSGDIGLFVTSGRFSNDAVGASRNSKEFIRILDGKDFIEMWQAYYDKMKDEDKNMLPLKRIAFLGNNE